MDFASYWQYTDAVSKTLFIVLVLLSLASWIIGIMRLVGSRQLARCVSQELRSQHQQQAGVWANLAPDQQRAAAEQALLQYISRYRYQSEQGLSLLGTTAAIAPFIGLFGTVWGIFHALHSIGETGQAGLAQVAAPVGEALTMTGLGLAVAIPAVVLYNIAMRFNRAAMYHANDTARALLTEVITAARQP